jgi:hypothetical protein
MSIRLEPFRNPKPALLNRFQSPHQSRIFSFFCTLHPKPARKNAYPPPPSPVQLWEKTRLALILVQKCDRSSAYLKPESRLLN